MSRRSCGCSERPLVSTTASFDSERFFCRSVALSWRGWGDVLFSAFRMDAHGGSSPGRYGTLFPLTLTALGVVYGDIGTSPLYAIRECFFGSHSVGPTHENVLGVLSLVLYALLLVISVKYTSIVMRADNQGEGGILALTALLPSRQWRARRTIRCSSRSASSVRAALRRRHDHAGDQHPGRGRRAPGRDARVHAVGRSDRRRDPGRAVPDSASRHAPRRRTLRSGDGGVVRHDRHPRLSWIVRAPEVLGAFDPRHAINFFVEHGWHGFAVLGAVVPRRHRRRSAVRGHGALRQTPIRLAWFCLVLPALLLNYFGQGALLLVNGTAATQPFFMMAPPWALLPLVALSTAAAIIASQALISGAFSLTRQAIQLGYAPRLDIEHTSSTRWARSTCRR